MTCFHWRSIEMFQFPEFSLPYVHHWSSSYEFMWSFNCYTTYFHFHWGFVIILGRTLCLLPYAHCWGNPREVIGKLPILCSTDTQFAFGFSTGSDLPYGCSIDTCHIIYESESAIQYIWICYICHIIYNHWYDLWTKMSF